MKEITKLAAKRVEKLKKEKTETKIDISNWGNFRVGDLFEIKLSKNDIRFERCNTGSTPLISAGNENNGIVGYIDKEDFEVFPANSITVNVFGKAFVQTKDFCASVNILIIRNEHLTKNIGMFIAAILSKSHSKYNYNDKISKDKLFNETISLPVTPEGTPDFDYMEDYMKEITKLAAKRVEKLKKEKTETKIDTSKWGKFIVGELFDCETTKGIASKNDLVEGNIPYVTRSAENNGKSGYCGNADRIVKGNCITIGAEGFTAFYQENDFVAGNKVYALRHRNLNNVNALYICTVLNKLSCLYSFNNARILDKIKQEVISLPIDNNGEPDWQYMEDYMKNVMEQAENRI